jgi:hypothetical protein
MLLVDDILLFPVSSIMWMFHKIHAAAQEELANEKDTLTARLSELYMMLETGQLTEAEFNKEEKQLLDRLDKLESRAENDDDEEEDDEEEEEDEDESDGRDDDTIEVNRRD